MLSAVILGISIHDPYAYIDLPVVLLPLTAGLLIRKISPRSRANSMLFKTALAGAIIVFLYFLSIEIPWAVFASPFGRPYPFIVRLLVYVIGYSCFYGWYLECWLFLQFFFEHRWESQGALIDGGTRRKARILTLIPICIWIVLGIVFRIFSVGEGQNFASYWIYYRIAWLLIFEIIFATPLFFALGLGLTRQDAGKGEIKSSSFYSLRIILIAIGLAFLESQGSLVGNIWLAIFLIVLLVMRLIGKATKKAKAEFQAESKPIT
jgi:hypothetical protein